LCHYEQRVYVTIELTKRSQMYCKGKWTRTEFSKSIPVWTGRPSNKTPAPATCWSRHLSRDDVDKNQVSTQRVATASLASKV